MSLAIYNILSIALRIVHVPYGDLTHGEVVEFHSTRLPRGLWGFHCNTDEAVLTDEVVATVTFLFGFVIVFTTCGLL